MSWRGSLTTESALGEAILRTTMLNGILGALF